MTTEAFTPISNTFALDVTATSQLIAPTISPTPAEADIVTGGFEYRFANVGTQVVYLRVGTSGAAIPATGANSPGIILLPGTVITLKFIYGTQFNVIAPATGSTIYVCIGRGVVA